LKFTFTQAKNRQNELEDNYSGSWGRLSDAPSFPDDMSLEGWNTYLLGLFTTNIKGVTIINYRAKPVEAQFSNLGQLRGFLSSSKKP
jgi:hypothetical protein